MTTEQLQERLSGLLAYPLHWSKDEKEGFVIIRHPAPGISRLFYSRNHAQVELTREGEPDPDLIFRGIKARKFKSLMTKLRTRTERELHRRGASIDGDACKALGLDHERFMEDLGFNPDGTDKEPENQPDGR